LPEDKVESVTGMSLTADGNGAVFDVKKEDVDTFLAGNVIVYWLSYNFLSLAITSLWGICLCMKSVLLNV